MRAAVQVKGGAEGEEGNTKNHLSWEDVAYYRGGAQCRQQVSEKTAGADGAVRRDGRLEQERERERGR